MFDLNYSRSRNFTSSNRYEFSWDLGFTMALASREIHAKAMREVIENIRETGGSRLKVMHQMIESLQKECIIDEMEGRKLKEVCELVDCDKPYNQGTLQEIQKTYTELVDAEANPTAIAVAGVALNSIEFGIVNDDGTKGPVAGADVAGALGGANLGKNFGGVWGAVGGAILGGGATSLAAWL